MDANLAKPANSPMPPKSLAEQSPPPHEHQLNLTSMTIFEDGGICCLASNHFLPSSLGTLIRETSLALDGHSLIQRVTALLSML